MKKIIIIFSVIILLVSCNKKINLKNIYKCTPDTFSNLENVTDIKKLFTINISKNWKTNLYFDTSQTSIYCADTTKQLTETTLIDVSFIYRTIEFTKEFKKKVYLKNKLYQLKQIMTKEIQVLNKPSYFVISKGVKQGFSYQKSSIYIKINDTNFILAKIEIFGDSLIKQRFCKAFKLIDKIQLK